MESATARGYLKKLECEIRERNEGNDGNAENKVGIFGMREIRVGIRGIVMEIIFQINI